MTDFFTLTWDGINHLFGIIGNVITFKLSFIFLLCIAFYTYKAFSSAVLRSSRHKTKDTGKQAH